MDMPPKHEGTQGTKNQASEKASGPLGFKPKTENGGLEATGRDRTSVSLQSQARLQLPGATQRSGKPPQLVLQKKIQSHRDMYLLHQNDPYPN